MTFSSRELGMLAVALSACIDPGATEPLVPRDAITRGGAAALGGTGATGGQVAGAGGSHVAGVSAGGSAQGGVVASAGSPVDAGGAPGGAGQSTQGGTGGNSGGPTQEGGGNGDPLAQGGASKCPLASSLLCDGFEGAAPGDATSAFKLEVGSGSSGVVDGTKAFRGSKSVHFKTNGGQAFITETATFTGTTAAANNAHWGRIWIWFETSAKPNSHDVFIRLEDPSSKADSAQLHVAGGSRGQLAAEIRSGSDLYRPKIIDPRPETAPPGTVMFPLAQPKWQCWEWHTTADNTLEFFIDGEEYEKMRVTAADKWPFPIFKKLYLGFMQFGTTPATELWLDEVAVSTERVGCGQ